LKVPLEKAQHIFFSVKKKFPFEILF
jgi:hypothetical protein